MTNVTQYVIILYKQLRSETPKHSQRGYDLIRDKKSKTIKTFQLLGGNMSNSNVTIFNGTFRKQNGDARTMRFIRRQDIPSSLVNEGTIKTMESKTGAEVVYDVDARAFRHFNWKTVQGDVTETSSTFNF